MMQTRKDPATWHRHFCYSFRPHGNGGPRKEGPDLFSVLEIENAVKTNQRKSAFFGPRMVYYARTNTLHLHWIAALVAF